MPDVLLDSQQRQWDDLRTLLGAYARHDPPRTVAVVGNAPLPPDPRRAAEIDAADLVIRANAMVLDAPGGPACVGTACDVVILSRSTAITPWVFADYRRRLYLEPQGGFVRTRYDVEFERRRMPVRQWPADLGLAPLPNAVVKARLADLLDPDHRPGALIPTTGLTAVFLAHEMFPGCRLVATGFSFLDDAGQKHWAHHSGGHTKVNWQHDLNLEAQLMSRWIADGSIEFLR